MAHRILRIIALAALTVALTAAAASASERFASASGTGSGCTQAQPCNIVTAINDAATGDDIEIEPGTYGSPTPISTSLSSNSKTLTIHGEAGEPMPVIHTDASVFGIGLSGGGSLSYVDIEDSSNTLRTSGIEVVSQPAAIDHVISHVTGSDFPIACAPIGTLIDSLCWSSGSGGTGASIGISGPMTQTSTLINDTLIGSGSGAYGVLAEATGAFTTTLNMTNSIAHGVSADVFVDSGPHPPTTVTLNADHSNYATLKNANDGGTVTATSPGTGSNQLAAPAFVDAAAGNFRELAGSPTVHAGVVDSFAGTTDLDGNPRQDGSFTDIGAYQYFSPPSCSAASASTKFGTAVSLHLQCSDALGDPIALGIKSGPVYGKVVISGGSVTYSPNAGYSGSDSFTYTGTSKLGTSAPATVSVTVRTKPAGKKVAPVISHAKQSKGVFTFTLNEAATVTLSFKLHGRVRGTLKIAGKSGKNTIRVKGRLSKHHKLRAGAYVVTIAASNAGGRSKGVTVKYKLAARR